MQIAFQTSNTIFHQLRHRPPHNQQKASGIYRLQCNTCSKSYIGQTGRSVATHYREHIRYIKTNNPSSGYATHILNNRHDYDKPELTVQLLQICEKGNIMNCWESLHIQLLQQQLLIDEQRVNDLNSLVITAHHTTQNE